MENLIKAVTYILPVFWQFLNKSGKFIFVAVSFISVIVYTVMVSWATIRLELGNAYDARWYRLAKEQDIARTETINSIQSDIIFIKDTQKETGSDIRDIRNALMAKHK